MSDTIAVSFSGMDSKPLVIQEMRTYYPDIVDCKAVFIANGQGEPNPGFRRWRSRDRHQPGSSKYACTFVYALPGGITGWYYNRCLYIYTGSLSGYTNANNYYSFSKTPSSFQDAWAWYNGRTYSTNTYWYVNGWSGAYRAYARYVNFRYNYNGKVDLPTAIALAVPISDQQKQSNGRHFLPELSSTPEPKREERHMAEQIDNDAVPNLDAFLNSAYVDAYTHLPQITTNNVQNLLEVFSILKRIVSAYGTGNLAKGVTEVGSLSDAWLGYRYAYSTTRMDIEELASYVDRVRNIAHSSSLYSRGSYTYSDGHGDYIIRCSMEVPVKENSEALSLLERMGLALDGYNTWDLIPYSFVVDWFLHIGDFLEAARSRRYAERIRPSSIWFSITHDYANANGQHQCDYYRWQAEGSWWHRLATMPASMLSHSAARGTTWVKRGLDAICLIN